MNQFYYHPHPKLRHVSVILSTGGSASVHAGISPPPPGADPPRSRHPPRIRPPHSRPPRSRPPPPKDGYCCRRYASYWNAFLFVVLFQYFTRCSFNNSSFLTSCNNLYVFFSDVDIGFDSATLMAPEGAPLSIAVAITTIPMGKTISLS